ncbi:MAG: carboxypeptidase regulatory-like domain-containing protein [Planctomycetia bacterium]|nr:carboxypeptidase regulatory-like domain-containing protein [Planctomycetia bacterium]
MGLFSTMLRFSRRRGVAPVPAPARASATPYRRCRVEEVEPRKLLAADVQVGAVYFDPGSGFDETPNTIQITWKGGAAGTELAKLTIDADKVGDGLTIGDTFFDIADGGKGAYASHPFQLVSHDGFEVTNVSVVDGGQLLEFTFSGFTSDKKLIFTIDVDEQGFLKANSVAEGAEFEGSKLTATFQAPHYYDFTGTDIFFDDFDEKFAGSGLNLPNNDYQPPALEPSPVLTAGAIIKGPQVPLPSSLSGFVYDDLNLDNSQEGGEPGIGGVQLSLLEWNGSSYVATGLTTTTDANGAYRFENLLPAQYRVVETQPTGYFSIGAKAGTINGTTVGAVTSPDIISDVVLLGGEDSVHNDFAEARPGRITGIVHADLNGDCVYQPGEPLLAGVTIKLLNAQLQVVATTQTNASGQYEFTNLRPGAYTVMEDQPQGYLDGGDEVGSAGGILAPPDGITDIVLLSGTNGVDYNFCEIPPARLAGKVYLDTNNNGVFDAAERGIGGVTLALLDGGGNPLGVTTVTDASGAYRFENLAPGAYGVAEIQPAGYLDGLDAAGSAGGTALNPGDKITGAVLVAAMSAVNYNFGELLPNSISGRVHVDTNADCQFDADEKPLAGVVLKLLDGQNQVIATTQTDATGQYKFDNLPPGTYTVVEVQPSGYLDGDDHVGSVGGVLVPPDSIAQIALVSDVHGTEYNFCELPPATLAGNVYVDDNNDGLFDATEHGIGGVTVILLGADGTPLGPTTVTDAAGAYRFENLPPGTYGVAEVQPAGYFDGLDTAGSAGGTAQNPGDKITGAVLVAGINAVDYNFGELRPASLSGMIHADLNGDCVFQPGEPQLAGVTVQLFGAQGQLVAATTTNAQGEYSFGNLAPGTYTVREVQPAGYFDGGEEAGSAGGLVGNDTIAAISLGSGVAAVGYNFCEIPPATLAGNVYVDDNNNGVFDPAELGIGGVELILLGADGTPLGPTTVTNAAGAYRFENLPPGAYGVAEVQPAGYFDGLDTAGSAGGTAQNPGDKITGAVLVAGMNAINYNFGEIPPASISGRVFVDRNGECVFQPGETLLSGVTIQLLDPGGNVIATTTTNAAGQYSFTGLPPGTYGVHEIQPSDLLEGGNNVGSAGGVVFDVDTLIAIPLGAGVAAVDYNFCETVPQNTVILPTSPIVIPELRPLALPPQPRVIIPFIPEDVPIPRLTLYYGGGYAMGYTWHLSIIDAGRPRGDQSSSDQRLALISMQPTEPFERGEEEVHNSQWLVGADDTEDGGRQVFRFGMRNGIPVTGDFNGDGITDIGFYYKGEWFIDLDGNGAWDSGDLWAKLGYDGDKPVTGDWDGDGKTDIGIFGRAWPGDPKAVKLEPGLPAPHNTLITGKKKNVPPPTEQATFGWRLLKHTAQGEYRSDLIDHVFHYGTPGDIPITGDWHGTGVHTIGLFHKGRWLLDANGDGRPNELDYDFQYGDDGDLPVIGDFNGDGIDELGVYRNGAWYIDTNNDRVLDARDKLFELGGPGDVPVVGDWNGDGTDEPGVYREGAAAGPAPAPAATTAAVPTPAAQ